MMQNAYLLAKIGADTAENEQHFAEILPKIGNYPTGRLTPRRRAAVRGRGQRCGVRRGGATSWQPAGRRASRHAMDYGSAPSFVGDASARSKLN